MKVKRFMLSTAWNHLTSYSVMSKGNLYWDSRPKCLYFRAS